MPLWWKHMKDGKRRKKFYSSFCIAKFEPTGEELIVVSETNFKEKLKKVQETMTSANAIFSRSDGFYN